MFAFVSIHDTTMVQQKHPWRHNGAHTGYPQQPVRISAGHHTNGIELKSLFKHHILDIILCRMQDKNENIWFCGTFDNEPVSAGVTTAFKAAPLVSNTLPRVVHCQIAPRHMISLQSFVCFWTRWHFFFTKPISTCLENCQSLNPYYIYEHI